jgi:hypothetical protein
MIEKVAQAIGDEHERFHVGGDTRANGADKSDMPSEYAAASPAG